jgi:hypothetical protein
VSTARHERLRRDDADRRRGVDEVTRFPVQPSRVALADPDLAREHEGLGATPGLDEAAVDKQLVEALA